MKRRLFRWHRRELAESLGTTVDVRSLSDMISYIIKEFPAENYLSNIRIKDECIDDSSLAGANWKEQHMVLADFGGFTGQCIGWCNFIADTTPQELLEEAIVLATRKHTGQVDKGGMPYILHPIRVMMSIQSEYAHRREKPGYWDMCIAAVLHDVIEDTPTTPEELSVHGFSADVTNLLTILTKDMEEEYAHYIRRIVDSGNNRAMIIKLADLRDNLDEKRMPAPLSEEDKRRKIKYLTAMSEIDAALEDRVVLNSKEQNKQL